MRLVKLKQVPIKVEGKFGSVIIEQDGKWMCVSTSPDTGCKATVFTRFAIGSSSNLVELGTSVEGHRTIMEKSVS